MCEDADAIQCMDCSDRKGSKCDLLKGDLRTEQYVHAACQVKAAALRPCDLSCFCERGREREATVSAPEDRGLLALSNRRVATDDEPVPVIAKGEAILRRRIRR